MFRNIQNQTSTYNPLSYSGTQKERTDWIVNYYEANIIIVIIRQLNLPYYTWSYEDKSKLLK